MKEKLWNLLISLIIFLLIINSINLFLKNKNLENGYRQDYNYIHLSDSAYHYEDSLYISFQNDCGAKENSWYKERIELRQEIENYAIENRSLLRELNSCKNNQNYQVISPICH